MIDDVDQYAADMVVSDCIEHILAVALGAHEAGGAQQPQVVADEGGRSGDLVGNLAHRTHPLKARRDDAKPCRIPKQAEHIGNFGSVLANHVGKSRYFLFTNN